jgi:hypothetical protein
MKKKRRRRWIPLKTTRGNRRTVKKPVPINSGKLTCRANGTGRSSAFGNGEFSQFFEQNRDAIPTLNAVESLIEANQLILMI